MSINKYGNCPNCNTNWDMGDIKSVIKMLGIFVGKTEHEIDKICAMYGYTEFNKGNFSMLEVMATLGGRDIAKCPNMRCGHYFDVNTGDEFLILRDALEGNNKIERV